MKRILNWLRNLVSLVTLPSQPAPRQRETTPISQDDIETYVAFLQEILLKTSQSNGDAQVIYPLLAANTDKLNHIFAELWRDWLTNLLAEAKPETVTDIAADIVNFSNLIQQFPLGSKASNMEIAITGYEIALTVYTRSAFPVNWATTQNNLGAAHRVRILGERAENIEMAIAAYSAALFVRTRSAFPEKWATTQNNLGTAYRDRILGERAENIEMAIAAYSAALFVRTRSAFPEKWAMTQNNLGVAYGNRILGERAENIEMAIAAYSAALEVYTRSAFPEKWAGTQNNLGAAYRNRILGERAENIEMAIAAYSAALEVYTRSAFPQNNAETLLNLGWLYQDEREFNLAYNTFIQAIETVEALRGEIVSGEEAKRKQAEEWNKLYRRMVEVCLELGRDTEAIEYIERSKTRNLVELLTKALTNPENLPVGSSIKFRQIQNLLDSETVIIQWYIFNDCFRAFIITRDNNQPIIWRSDEADLEKLANWNDKYLQLYSQDKKQWQFRLNDLLSELAPILHLNQIVDLVPKHCQKLILIPHLYLHLFPLHALPLSIDSATREYLIDKFPRGVSYAPSCQLLRFAQQRVRVGLNQRSDLFAIQNPTNDLQFADIEVETIAADFRPKQVLKHHQASKEALTETSTVEKFCNSQWLHFSCHGYFNFQTPLKSGLALAGAKSSDIPANSNPSRYLRVDEQTTINLDKCLTLEDIFKLNLNKCGLVTLSACETGLIDFSNNSDEYIGLSSGFIHAGATNIISSLWAVSDFHTALLMIKFYEILPNHTYNVPLALNATQQWRFLRT
ncbi:MAG: CHAT domain-containing protein [Gloeotrichia echinulata DVL01]|jgi:CHAT domain-containing protein